MVLDIFVVVVILIFFVLVFENFEYFSTFSVDFQDNFSSYFHLFYSDLFGS